jgi:dienelactone hydrolase
VRPVFAGTYERNDGRTRERISSPNSARELILQWAKDLGRTLDYIDEREDIDGGKVAYVGFSLGSWLAPRFLTLDNRIRAAMLWVGGFPGWGQPEFVIWIVDLTRRTTTPVLMLNGRYDPSFVVDTQVTPMFELLGTPKEHKRLVIYDTSHWGFPRNELIRENLAWVDRYLGPVEKPGG